MIGENRYLLGTWVLLFHKWWGMMMIQSDWLIFLEWDETTNQFCYWGVLGYLNVYWMIWIYSDCWILLQSAKLCSEVQKNTSVILQKWRGHSVWGTTAHGLDCFFHDINNSKHLENLGPITNIQYATFILYSYVIISGSLPPSGRSLWRHPVEFRNLNVLQTCLGCLGLVWK